jgi:hypothetical protein
MNYTTIKELIDYLVSSYNKPSIQMVKYNDDIVFTGGSNMGSCPIVILSPKYPDFIFFIKEEYSHDYITIGIAKSGICIDQIPSISLPMSYQEEIKNYLNN